MYKTYNFDLKLQKMNFHEIRIRDNAFPRMTNTVEFGNNPCWNPRENNIYLLKYMIVNYNFIIDFLFLQWGV